MIGNERSLNVPRIADDDPNYENVMRLFNSTCILCRATFGVTVHELIPRSLAPKSWKRIDNRVCLCNDCHTKIHNMSKKDRDDLLLPARDRALKLNQ